MDRARPEPIKHRDIGFRDPHPDPQQTQSAARVLNAVEGIVHVSIPNPGRPSVHISYDLNCISLRLIEGLLGELGYHLDNSLMSKLKRALYNFTEENEIRALAMEDDQDHSPGAHPDRGPGSSGADRQFR